MKENNAITSGVAPGGLTNRTEIRILICYILMSVKQPVPCESIKQLFHFEGIANYIEIGGAIAELEKNELIEIVDVNNDETNDTYYRSTEKGNDVAQTLKTSVPISIRDKGYSLTIDLLTKLRYRKENSVIFDKTTKGILVTCKVLEGATVLMEISLLVPNMECANLIKENFLNDPAYALSHTTEALTKTKFL